MDPNEDQPLLPGPPPLPEEPQTQPPPPRKPYPGFWQAVGLILLYILGTTIVMVPAGVIDGISKTTLLKEPWTLGLASLTGCLLAVHTALSRLRLSWTALAGPFHVPPKMLLAIVAVVAGQVIVTLVVLFSLLRWFPSLMPTESYGLDRNLIGAAIMLMAIAPLGEEMLFRGVMLRGFVPRYGLTKGIALGALLFALTHMSIAKLFGTFLIGFVFGWWYTKTGSIWPGVIGHALNNGLPVLLVAFQGKDSLKGYKHPPFSWMEPVIGLLGLALLVQGILAMRRYFELTSNEPSSTDV